MPLEIGPFEDDVREGVSTPGADEGCDDAPGKTAEGEIDPVGDADAVGGADALGEADAEPDGLLDADSLVIPG